MKKQDLIIRIIFILILIVSAFLIFKMFHSGVTIYKHGIVVLVDLKEVNKLSGDRGVMITFEYENNVYEKHLTLGSYEKIKDVDKIKMLHLQGSDDFVPNGVPNPDYSLGVDEYFISLAPLLIAFYQIDIIMGFGLFNFLKRREKHKNAST